MAFFKENSFAYGSLQNLFKLLVLNPFFSMAFFGKNSFAYGYLLHLRAHTCQPRTHSQKQPQTST